MNYCNECGAELWRDDLFCSTCGHRHDRCAETAIDSGGDTAETEVVYTTRDWSDDDLSRVVNQLKLGGVEFEFGGDELVVAKKHESLVDRLVGDFDQIIEAPSQATGGGSLQFSRPWREAVDQPRLGLRHPQLCGIIAG